MTRHKSPRYPSLHLEEAVALSRKLTLAVGRGPLDRGLAIQGMGLSPNGSTGKRSLASLLAFGLWEKVDAGRIKQSELGRRVLAAPDPQLHAARELQEAALSPAIHARIYENWKDGLPQEDQGLIAWLRMEANFHPDAAIPVIEEVRRSFDYARVYDGAKIASPASGGTDQDDDEDDGEDPMTEGALAARAAPGTAAAAGAVTPRAAAPEAAQPAVPSGPHIRFTLAGNNVLEVCLQARVSKREFEKIKKIVDLAEDSFVTEATEE